MGEYFHGWKRKLGVMTLAVACLFMAGWIRSFLVHDQIQIPSDASLKYCVSYDGQFQWTAMSGTDLLTGIDVAKGPGRVTRYEWFETPIGVFHKTPKGADPTEFNWRWHWYGFDLREAKWQTLFPLQAGCVQVYRVQYWIVVIPLTLVSAWLLMSKPRKLNRNNSPEPTPTPET